MQVDDVVHQRVRLGVLALISKRARGFTDLRDELGQSDGGLGRHLKVLAEAGYVTLTKSFQDNRPRTEIELTEAGRAALDDERRALTQLISNLDTPDPFAFPAGAGRRFAASTRTTDLILSETFSPFYVAEQWPLGPDFALPDRCPAWPSYPMQRATFLSHGLLGSHLRRWTTVTKEEWINTMLLEFADADAPERIMSGLADPTVYVPGFLPTRAYQHGDTCVIWLRRGPFLGCISVSGEKDVAQNRANTLVRDQYRLLPPSDRDAAEPIAARVAHEGPDRGVAGPGSARAAHESRDRGVAGPGSARIARESSDPGGQELCHYGAPEPSRGGGQEPGGQESGHRGVPESGHRGGQESGHSGAPDRVAMRVEEPRK